MGKRDDAIAEKVQLLKARIRDIPKGTVFTDEVALILYLATKTGLDRTTLKRNPKYYREILAYLGKQPGAAGIVDIETADKAVLRAKLMQEQAEKAALAMENERLKKAVARLSGSLDGEPHPLLQAPSGSIEPDVAQGSLVSSSSDNPSDRPNIAFTSTAMTLALLLERLAEKGIPIVVNRDKQQIEDRACYGGKRLVAGADRAKWFFEFLAANPHLSFEGSGS